MSSDKTQTGIRFTPEVLLKTKYIAKMNRRSFNAQLEFLAVQDIEEFEKQHGKIELNEQMK